MQRYLNGPSHPSQPGSRLPAWVPSDAKHYLAHTEGGLSIRELARKGGCAPSTVMRQVRRVEQKRDDPLIDEALEGLRAAHAVPPCSSDLSQTPEYSVMSKPPKIDELTDPATLDDVTVAREAKRVLRRLSEPGACLAVAMDMEKAVVVRDLPDGRTTRTAVLDRAVAQAIALQGWIAAQVKGKITRYSITAAGRTALREFLAADEGVNGRRPDRPHPKNMPAACLSGAGLSGADLSGAGLSAHGWRGGSRASARIKVAPNPQAATDRHLCACRIAASLIGSDPV